MRHRLAHLTVALVGAVFVAHVWAQPPWASPGNNSHGFQGYWMGVDPVDGENGNFALAGRDTVLTLCDGTDRGFASFDDGAVVGRNVMESNALTIECFNNAASVVLHVRYELIGNDLMLEHTTRPDGSLVSTIVFHKVSQD